MQVEVFKTTRVDDKDFFFLNFATYSYGCVCLYNTNRLQSDEGCTAASKYTIICHYMTSYNL